MKNKTNYGVFDTSYTVQSEEVKPFQRKEKSKIKKLTTVLEILIVVMIAMVAMFCYTMHKTGENKISENGAAEAYTPVNTASPAYTIDDSSSDYQDDDQQYTMFSGMKIYQSKAPELYTFLSDYYTSDSTVQLIQAYDYDYSVPDGVIAKGDRSVGNIVPTMKLSIIDGTCLSCDLGFNGSASSSDTFHTFTLSGDGTQVGTDEFAGDKILTITLDNIEGSAYIVCSNADGSAMYVFEVSKDIITNLEGV